MNDAVCSKQDTLRLLAETARLRHENERLRDLLKHYHTKVDLFGESLEEHNVKIPFAIDFGPLLGLQEVHREVRQTLAGEAQ